MARTRLASDAARLIRNRQAIRNDQESHRMSRSGYRGVQLRDGRTLVYAEHGSPSGLPIIYCHGVPSSRVEGDLFIDSAMVAALGLRVIVPDRPGMGHSQYKTGRRIVDWPDDVMDLAKALGLGTFAVLGSSGGAPYAAACGALIPHHVRVVGVLGGVAPVDAPGILGSMSGPLRVMFHLGRHAPALLRGLFRLNQRAMRRGGPRASQRMARWAPEPDRTLLQRAEIRDGFMACFDEACRQGARGPALDMSLIARPWGFDLAAVNVPVLLWHGERDRNVPVACGRYLASAFPRCRATFYAEDAHLSVPLNHQEEIFGALATALSEAPNPGLPPTAAMER
jgi:pimeloyl-ACP methyl ester carboxylesterase